MILEKNNFYLLVLLIAFITSSCTSAPSKKLAASYGQATTAMAATAIDKYHGIQDLEYTARIMKNIHSFDDAAKDFFSAPVLSEESVGLRISLLDQLGRYGKALEAIASDNELENIDKASKELYGSLSGINATIKKEGNSTGLSDNDLGVIATVVNVAGRAYFEYQRHQILSTIVENADPLIVQVIDLLTNEFKEKWFSVEKSLKEEVKKSLFDVSRNQAYQLDDKSADLKYFQIRRNLLEEAQKINRSINTTPEKEPIIEGLKKVKEAHQELKIALKQDSSQIQNMDGLILAIAAIKNEIARAKSFKSELSKP
jgi:hypothetical protein